MQADLMLEESLRVLHLDAQQQAEILGLARLPTSPHLPHHEANPPPDPSLVVPDALKYMSLWGGGQFLLKPPY